MKTEFSCVNICPLWFLPVYCVLIELIILFVSFFIRNTRVIQHQNGNTRVDVTEFICDGKKNKPKESLPTHTHIHINPTKNKTKQMKKENNDKPQTNKQTYKPQQTLSTFIRLNQHFPSATIEAIQKIKHRHHSLHCRCLLIFVLEMRNFRVCRSKQWLEGA